MHHAEPSLGTIRAALRGGFFAVLAASACWGPAVAQTPSPTGDPARAERERQMSTRQGELDAAERRAVDVAREIERLAAERAQAKSQLVEAANAVQKSEARLTEIEERLVELTARETRQRTLLAGRHAELAKLLAAMQRMGRNPPPVIVTERKDVLEMIRSAKLLARVFPELNEKAVALSKELRQLEAVASEARGERDRLRAETNRYNTERTRLAALLDTNQKITAERERELAAIRRESDTIRRSVTELGELIRRHDQLVSRRAEIAAYEDEVRRQKAAEAAREAAERARAGAAAAAPGTVQGATPGGAPSTAPPAAVAVPTAPPPQEGVKVAMNVPRPPVPERPVQPIVLAPGSGRAITNPGRLKPEIPFYRAKGKLPLPSSGRHVIRFGETTQLGSRSPGLVISTRPGAQITSPSDGWVLFAGPFRSYGQLLIINAGDGYHILMTGLSRIDVQVGQFVLAAEPVGAMSPVAGPKTDGASEGPVLYVEFRKDGKPIDPSPWWAEGQKKVQG
ncbi:MAG: peptidoglycan DD-metalloendopeptidase family protein [Hyphomicrobiaceae bacterium]